MPNLRFAISLSALLCVAAASASAQGGGDERVVNGTDQAPASALPIVKAPVEALVARGANPKGPFAKLRLTQRDSIIEGTRDLLGVRYKWAGLNPAKGLDCSGIVKYVFSKFGVELPHRAAELAKLGGAIAKDTSAMRPGDLLVFGKGKRISHVGIYVGDGMMIHASSKSKRVVEAPVVKYRRPGGLQWKGVRRVIALDSTVVVDGETGPMLPR